MNNERMWVKNVRPGDEIIVRGSGESGVIVMVGEYIISALTLSGKIINLNVEQFDKVNKGE